MNIQGPFYVRRLLPLALAALFAAAPLAAQTENDVLPPLTPLAQEGTGAALGNWLHSWFNVSPVTNHWYIGLYAGYANNHLYQGGSSVDAYYDVYNITYNNGHGFTIGLPFRFQIFNWLAVQAEAEYSQKNYSFVRTADLTSIGGPLIDYPYAVTNHFMDFPVMANLSWGFGQTGIRVFGNIGIFTGVWAASHAKGETYALKSIGVKESIDTDIEFDDKTDNRFDAGLLTGFGVQYDFNPLSLYLEARYNYSFTDLQKPYYEHSFIPKKNDTWTVQLGILFNSNVLALLIDKWYKAIAVIKSL